MKLIPGKLYKRSGDTVLRNEIHGKKFSIMPQNSVFMLLKIEGLCWFKIFFENKTYWVFEVLQYGYKTNYCCWNEVIC